MCCVATLKGNRERFGCFSDRDGNSIRWSSLKHHYVTLTATHSFKKRTLTVTQNSNFGKTRSYFTEEMSSGFPSDVIWLLCINSVNHGGSWEQHVGACRPALQLQQQQHRVVVGGSPWRSRAKSIGPMCNGVCTLFHCTQAGFLKFLDQWKRFNKF